jgi:hypothetical protein
MDFPHDKFGLSTGTNYTVGTQLDLARTAQESGHVRQRRQWVHNPSAVEVSFILLTPDAKSLVAWLNTNKDQWFFMRLISGNDLAEKCPVHMHEVKRITDVKADRLGLSNKFVCSFSVEVRNLEDYALFNTKAIAEKNVVYPSTLPLPVGSTFSADINDLGVSTYQLTYNMSSAKLKEWLAFASSSGTWWFRSKMVSPSTPCGTELIRYTTDISQNLIGPDTWEVTVTAETLPTKF